MVECWLKKWFQVTRQGLRTHNHGITACYEYIRYLFVLLQILFKASRFVRRKFEIWYAHKLRPAKTIGAIGMTGLSMGRNQQAGLLIFMLDTWHRFFVQDRDVVCHLSTRVWIELRTNSIANDFSLLTRGSPTDFPGHALVVLRSKHPLLHKGKLIDGIIGDVLPINQFLYDIGICPKRENVSDDLHGKTFFGREASKLRQHVDVVNIVELYLACSDGHDHLLYWMTSQEATEAAWSRMITPFKATMSRTRGSVMR